MKRIGLVQIIVLILLINNLNCTESELELGHEGTVDPFHEILEFYNLKGEQNFTQTALEELFHDFAAKIHCTEELRGDHKEELEACANNFCVNVSSVLAGLDVENDPFITENTFDEISLILLEIAIGFNDSCHTELLLTNESLVTYKADVINKLTGGKAGLNLVSIQDTLELIVLGDEVHSRNTEADPHFHDEADDQSHNEADNQSHNEADNHSHEEAEESHSDQDQHHIDLILEKCLDAGTVYDQLGLDLDGYVSTDNAGKIASLAVYHILNGAKVSHDCRILPRPDFFFKELDHMYGNGNKTLGTKGFSKVMEALQIGNVLEQSHTGEETHDDHGHRRKRSTEEADMHHESTWETTCYTDEQLLAIFHADDGDIPAETFNIICPALIQQKLAGVCVHSEEDVEAHGKRPTKAEKYGYGSLAAVIVCLCSVVGAIIVKVASSKAYDVIMALFLGLAVGTLFTDAMIHLLPTALGVHGHSGEEHMHSEDGIVVEKYVWYSLAACSALYVFYLMEKIMVMMRGQHVHSHGLSNVSDDNKLVLSTADKYTKESDSENHVKDIKDDKKRTVSNIAVMILMGDAVHNFADGLAIGASFSSSVALGLSTSIAVFCHELPHELGDFAVLLATGISFGRALFLNVLVSITALIGLYVGLVISDNETVMQWIVAIAGGLFIYISLVDMMPSLLQRSANGFRDFILNNVGILLGAGAMLTLAIFEEKIKINLST